MYENFWRAHLENFWTLAAWRKRNCWNQGPRHRHSSRSSSRGWRSGRSAWKCHQSHLRFMSQHWYELAWLIMLICTYTHAHMKIYFTQTENHRPWKPHALNMSKALQDDWESYIIANAPIIVASSTSRPYLTTWKPENLPPPAKPTLDAPTMKPAMASANSGGYRKKTKARLARNKEKVFFPKAFLEAGQMDRGSQQMLPWVQRGRGCCALFFSFGSSQTVIWITWWRDLIMKNANLNNENYVINTNYYDIQRQDIR